jgi:hypothetical protein
VELIVEHVSDPVDGALYPAPKLEGSLHHATFLGRLDKSCASRILAKSVSA